MHKFFNQSSNLIDIMQVELTYITDLANNLNDLSRLLEIYYEKS